MPTWAHHDKDPSNYNSIEEIDMDIKSLEEQIYKCVGWLYPSILRDRIAELLDRRAKLTDSSNT